MVEIFADYSYLTSNNHVIGKITSVECEEFIVEISNSNHLKLHDNYLEIDASVSKFYNSRGLS